jgi:hypothetical protein
MGKLLKFPESRWNDIPINCSVCGGPINELELLVIIMTNEITCSECFAWSGGEMLKLSEKRWRNKEQ